MLVPQVKQIMNGKVAIFIDAENISRDSFSKVYPYLGQFALQKAYGNWGAVHLSGWKKECIKLAIEMVYVDSTSKNKKNSSDIALAVGVMEALYTIPIDTFVIASSDSDFASLVHYLRLSGKKVIGIGQNNAIAHDYYDDFIFFESFCAELNEGKVLDKLYDNYYLKIAKQAINERLKLTQSQKLVDLAIVGFDMAKRWNIGKVELGVKKLIEYFEKHSDHFDVEKSDSGKVLVGVKN